MRPLAAFTAAVLLVACPRATDTTESPPCEEGWLDADGDGYGDPGMPACGPGTVPNAGDCDDAAVEIHSGAQEGCDGVDEDCDGEIDEAPAGPVAVYPDRDGDGHGDPVGGISLEGCAVPDGYVLLGDDCDDNDLYRSPSAAELCDGLDNRCDPLWTLADEDGHVTYYDEQGAPFDLTMAFQAGTALAPNPVQAPGGTLFVCPGSYAVNLHFSGPSRVVGRGAQVTLLDGGEGRVIEASADLTVEGLSLVGGDAQGGDGGGILMERGSLSVWGCELRNNEAGRGGAIAFLSDGAYPPAVLELVSVSFVNNDAGRGGALYMDSEGALSIVGSSFEGNVATGDGGAVAVDRAASVQLDQVEIYENIAVGRGGGLFVQVPGPVWAHGGLLLDNAATGQGGGAYLAGSQILLEGTTVASNLAGDVGGGMALFGQPVVELFGVSLLDNTTTLDGGGVYLTAGEAWLVDLLADHNEVTAVGVGGAVAAWATTLTVVGGTFTDNGAQWGGGLFLSGGSAQASALLDHPVLRNNRAQQAGGALLLDLPSVALTGALLSTNTASLGGGLSMSQGVVTLGMGASLQDNQASRGGALHLASGTFICEGDALAPPSLLRNGAELGGALLLSGQTSSFLASSCDLGAGADENIAQDPSTHDVFLEALEQGYDFEGLITTSCTATGCQ